MSEISICIPTYNRASILERTLEHLASIRGIELEIVVSDNASSDHTREVVDRFRGIFSNLIYYRQPENMGATINGEWACSIATSPLLYFLSDDDRIVPSSFAKIVRMFKADESLVAVYGNHCEFDPYTGKEYPPYRVISEDEAFVFDQRADMFEKFGQLWGPVMRSEVAHRFIYHDETTFGYWRIVDNLLKQGRVAVIPDLIYKHAQTVPRFEFSIVEPWYQDRHKSDFEMFIAGLDVDYNTPGIMDHIIQLVTDRSVQVYLSAFDFAAQQEKYTLQRHYLLRAKCYNLVSHSQLLEWEENFILHCVLERVESILKSLPSVATIYLESTPLSEYLYRIKSQQRFSQLPEIDLIDRERVLELKLTNSEMLIAEDYALLSQRRNRALGHEFALFDMISTLRVTSGNLDIKASC